MFDQSCAGLGSIVLSGAKTVQLAEQAALRKLLRHRDYNPLDCPVWQLRAWPTVSRAIRASHISLANGHQVAPDCPVCQVTNNWQRSTQLIKEGNQ
jgi:hypothetical protein